MVSWPLAVELQALLELAQVWEDGLAPFLDGALEEAVDQFQADTGFTPFLAGAEMETRRFNPPGPFRQPPGTLMGGGRLLALPGGFVELESLAIDQGQGAVTYAHGVQFVVEPANTIPKTMIRFTNNVFAVPQGITIVARWGYCDSLPPQARNGVLRLAALLLAPQIQSSQIRTAFSGAGENIKRKASGPLEIEYQTVDPTKAGTAVGLAAGYQAMYQGAVRRFRQEDF